MKRRILFGVFLVALSSPTLAAEKCTIKKPIVSNIAKPISIEVVNNLPANITVKEILEKLGPAARDVGSGLIVLQWDMSNGKIFSVSAARLCSPPISRGVHETK